jgi:hypothetical protein
MIRRYYATKDNSITNAYEENLTTRGTGSNMGASDVLEVFSIYGQQASASSELMRTIIQFDTAELIADRAAGKVPASGSVSWYLKMFNAPHSQTVPSEFDLIVSAVSSSWEEGYGLDMDYYEDLTKDGIGSNWINAKQRTAATATIVASTPGSLSNAATFTLTNAAGTTTTYRINGGGAYGTQAGGTAGSTIEVYFGGAGSVAHVAEAIRKAINATTSADMTATDDGTNVTVTQTTKGTTGNKTNTDNSSGLSSVGNFSGATGQWLAEGGDYHVAPTFTQTFSTGLEDMELDVSDLVEQWIKGPASGGKDNYGFGVKLPDATEAATRSFFTKKFFGRDSEFFFQRPVVEARWDSSRQDDRGAFYASSSLAPAADNLNSLFIHNSIRGRLQNIPTLGSNDIYVNLYDSLGGTKLAGAFTGSSPSTGIYKCDVFLETTSSTIYDVWFSGSNEYHSGTIAVKTFASTAYNPESAYVLSMPRLRKEYRKDQTHRLDLYARERDWSPNIYTVAVQASIPSLIIPSASFQVRRSIDDFVVVPYGTGSTTIAAHTALSYDVSGNYFDLDTTYLETGFLYEVQYSFYDEENGWEEQPYRFKFRVVD